MLRLEHLQDCQRQQFDDPAALVEALWALVDTAPPSGLGPSETTGSEVSNL